ncbi:extracellular solute-binding protein [Sediminispirochaeta bajacaliforniensis]|uniref:extracellular solute-binding protein n=1 Tax=Sediminispirochaeta bajacaliforniensis TaxID=148 RepID=UPI00036912EB|nr:extracellular solute-binding protein [Sediminispirochaeta bajacaliforniensis]
MKKQLFLRKGYVLVLLLAACALNLWAQGEKEEEKVIWVTSVQGGREPEENVLFENEVKRLSGVEVSMIKPPSSEYSTKLTAMLATGEPLDIVYIDSSLMVSLKDQDLFEPLTDRIEASKVLHDPSVIDPAEWERIRDKDGEIYGVFNKFEQGTLPIIRYDWLENLGLEAPTTLDEYYRVLKAFTFGDPDGNGEDDTYGLVVGYSLYDLSSLFGAYGLARGFVKDETGKLYSPYATEAAIPVYEFLARLYREGILEPNFITNKSSNFRDMFMTGKAGMTFYWAAWVGLFNQTIKAERPDSPFKARGITPPKGPDGTIMCRAGNDGLMAIPRVSKHKDAAFKVVEFWHTYDGNILSTLGIKDHDYTFENGTYELTEVGKAHAMDHGAPQPKSLAWVNPFGELEGFEEAAEIVRTYGKPQYVTAYDKQWEEISRAEAAKIILGKISPEEGIANMNKRFEQEGIF